MPLADRHLEKLAHLSLPPQVSSYARNPAQSTISIDAKNICLLKQIVAQTCKELVIWISAVLDFDIAAGGPEGAASSDGDAQDQQGDERLGKTVFKAVGKHRGKANQLLA